MLVLFLGTRCINVTLRVPVNNHVWRIVSDVKVLSLPLYWVLIIFWSCIGTWQTNISLWIPVSDCGLWTQGNVWCQGNQLASVFGITYFLELYRDQTDQHLSISDRGLWMQCNLWSQGNQLAFCICDWILENRPCTHIWPIAFYWPS